MPSNKITLERANLDINALDNEDFKSLCTALARLDYVRRIYLMENRADAHPTSDPISLALEAPEATDKQWQAAMAVVNEAAFKLGHPPYRLEDLDDSLRADFIKSGHKIYDQSDSPVSPT